MAGEGDKRRLPTADGRARRGQRWGLTVMAAEGSSGGRVPRPPHTPTRGWIVIRGHRDEVTEFN